jgi:hypothetical protein
MMQRELMNALEGKTIRDKRHINIVCNPRNTTIESIESASNRQVTTISNFHHPKFHHRTPVIIPLVEIHSIPSPFRVRHTHILPLPPPSAAGVRARLGVGGGDGSGCAGTSHPWLPSEGSGKFITCAVSVV